MTTFILKIIAMLTMTLDHTWYSLLPDQEWLTCVGRIAFPIFAYLTVESFYLTKNRKNYLVRMIIFALITEIPFDLMVGDTVFYPYHQNVLFTFLIAILGMSIFKWAEKLKKYQKIIVDLLIVLITFVLAFATFVDYYGSGLLLIYFFYFFRGHKWWQLLGQFIGMYIVNISMLGGYYYEIQLFGMKFDIYQQAIAMLALIPIWLHNGKQGYHSKWFKYACYAYYPGHALVLYLIRILSGI